MPSPLIIVGAGGHGREVLAVVRATNLIGAADDEFLGFVDDLEPDAGLLSRIGAVWLGPVDVCADLPDGTRFLIGIGAPEARLSVDQRVTASGMEPTTVVHPSATIGEDVELGAGVVVFAQASLTTNIRVGRHSHINTAATVAHDCMLGERVTVNPGANISGNVTIEDGATIGTGSSVIQGIRISRGAVVGAGSAVVRDVDAGLVVKGVPARS